MNEVEIDRKRKVLLKEYYEIGKAELPNGEFEAVVVLSAEETTVSGENEERIIKGLRIIKESQNIIPLIFMGTRRHNRYLRQYLAEKSIKAMVIFPNDRLEGSTRTQVKDLAVYLKKFPYSGILLVSHAYHIPRIKRYCDKYLGGHNINYQPIGSISKQSDQIESEIEKIIRYAKKGDLPFKIHTKR